MSMPNVFADAIEFVAEEPIIGVVIRDLEEWEKEDRNADDWRIRVPPEKTGIILSWDEAKPMLSYPWSRGYGSAQCHALYAWTETSVIVVTECDGSTDLACIPRNPVACEPRMM